MLSPIVNSNQFVQSNATFNGTNCSGTIASNALSVSVAAPGLTTAMASNRGTDFVQATAGFHGTNCSGTLASSGLSVSVAAPGGGGVALYDGANSITSGTAQFVNANGVSFSINGQSISGSVAAQSNQSISAGTSSGSFTGLTYSNSNSINFGLNNGTITAGLQPLSYFEPLPIEAFNSTVGTSFGFKTLLLQPFALERDLSFNQINFLASIGSLFASTSLANTVSVSFTASNQGPVTYSLGYSFSNTNLFDIVLFSLGGGGSSTDLVTVASTEVSYLISQWHSYGFTGSQQTGLASSASISISISSNVSLSVSFPAITSGTQTSVAGGTTITTWGPGYSNWTGSSSNSTSLATTTLSQTLSLSQTWAATVSSWSGYRMLPMPFNTSLGAGQYWLGIYQNSSSSSSSSTGNTGAGAGASYSLSGVTASGSNLRRRIQPLVYCNSILAPGGAGVAFGYAGVGVLRTNSLAAAPGQGTFSATYVATKTYYNNAGQAAGEIALSDINMDTVNDQATFRPWFAFGRNRI